MRMYNFLHEGWSFPSVSTMKDDFNEYKKKEHKKWERRADIIGARFPIFIDFEEFKKSLENAEVITVTKQFDNKISNRSQTSSIRELKNLVSSYVRPRNVDRIVQGIKSGAKLPYPIILKGNRGMWIMAGNTRLDSAFILGDTPKALLVDVGR